MEGLRWEGREGRDGGKGMREVEVSVENDPVCVRFAKMCDGLSGSEGRGNACWLGKESIDMSEGTIILSRIHRLVIGTQMMLSRDIIKANHAQPGYETLSNQRNCQKRIDCFGPNATRTQIFHTPRSDTTEPCALANRNETRGSPVLETLRARKCCPIAPKSIVSIYK